MKSVIKSTQDYADENMQLKLDLQTTLRLLFVHKEFLGTSEELELLESIMCRWEHCIEARW